MAIDTLKKIDEAVQKRPQELAEARKKGAKVVGWLGYNIPEEIIHALGLIPVRLGTGGDDRLVELGSRYLSTKNCVYGREIVGLFAENTDPYIKNSDLVAVDATCIQMYNASEVAKYFFKINTLVLVVPRNYYLPEAQEFFRKELQSFTHRLEEFAGNKLDNNKLAESIKLFNSIRKTIKELYKYQAADKPSIQWREVFNVVHAGFYLDREKYLSLLKELLKELKEKHGIPVIGSPNGDARIFLSGSIIPSKDTKLINIIEQVGGRIVGDELWSGLMPSLNVNIKDPSIKGIADAYINRVPHAALSNNMSLDTDKRLKNQKQLIHECKAQAVIYHTLRFCDPFTFNANETDGVLKKEDIPFLEIHTEYSGSDIEGIRTRTGAFIELIKNRNI